LCISKAAPQGRGLFRSESKMMHIRPSTKADFAAVDTILARSYPKLLKADYPPSILVTALPMISRAQPDLLVCGTYYVAEEDGVILGAGGWTPDRSDPASGHVRHLVTDHLALRRGVATALMARSFQEASAAGLRRLSCASTWTAEAFYQAQGFVTLGPMEVPLKDGVTFPAIRMTRDL
jgi:GNAT superfamily N-acetyltransferase